MNHQHYVTRQLNLAISKSIPIPLDVWSKINLSAIMEFASIVICCVMVNMIVETFQTNRNAMSTNVKRKLFVLKSVKICQSDIDARVLMDLKCKTVVVYARTLMNVSILVYSYLTFNKQMFLLQAKIESVHNYVVIHMVHIPVLVSMVIHLIGIIGLV